MQIEKIEWLAWSDTLISWGTNLSALVTFPNRCDFIDFIVICNLFANFLLLESGSYCMHVLEILEWNKHFVATKEHFQFRSNHQSY